MTRGEIWWVEHPEAGRRPACILTRQAAIPVAIIRGIAWEPGDASIQALLRDPARDLFR